jgi:hypothetical protein
MRILLLLLTLTLTSFIWAQPPTFEWANRMGSTGNDAGHFITTDGSGNVYSTGRFEGTVDFDPGVGVFNLTSAGADDIFVQKIDSAGNFIWASRMGGTGNDNGWSLITDGLGSLYLTGYFQNTVDFDPGAGVFNQTSGGQSDIFISKFDTNGNFIWAKSMGAGGSDVGYSITTDGSGNVYSTGYFQNTVDFDPGAGVLNLTSVGADDIFIQKLDANGNLIWIKQMGSTASEVGNSISTDGFGSVYLTGNFRNTVDFDPGAGVFNLTSAGGLDIYIQKLDSAGNFTWAKRMGGTGNDFGYSIITDSSSNVYTTGYFSTTVDFDPDAGVFNLTSAGGLDIYIQKLDSLGNFIWAKRMGDAGSDSGRSITTDGLGNLYTTGFFSNTVDFDPGAGVFNLTSVGGFDIYIQKLDSLGNFIWAKQFGGSGNEACYSLTTDGSNNIYSTGYFNNTVDFDPGVGVFNLTSAGSVDIYIQKLGQCISNTGSEIITSCVSYTWPLNSTTYTNSTNTPTVTLTNAAGCDSIVTLNLTINNSTSGTDTQVACDTYTWPLNSTTYTNSTNTPTATLTNAVGCDSVVTLDLIITNSNSDTDTQTACDSYLWIDGNTYTSSNNTATHTLTNAANCDSVVTLDLTISNSTSGTDTQTACDSYLWIDGNTYTSSNNTATHALTNAVGCDSVVILDLTINTVDSAVTQSGVTLSAVVSGASYQWLNCNTNFAIISGETNQSYTATTNGSYAVEITQNGCIDTSACYSITSVGIIESSFGNQLLLYPNPTEGNFSIDLGENYKAVTITMTDLSGKVIQSKTYNESQLLNLKLEEPVGVYLLIIEAKDKKAVIRLIKE